ncbi:ABC-2 type transport system permease protein [Conyzicola lurida]|uniref:ABC-2 type transport system permease protein n=1 Tax=Conyzicola lurida TaxID=1172621 RepID=A0A841ARY8_9MICO|nr:ABC-2 type transport system permease protein [Conyzicola lurida]
MSTTGTHYSRPATLPAIWLVAEREIRMRLRSKAFLISTGILLLLVLGSIVAGGILGANQSLPSVAAVGSAVTTVEATDAFEVTEADSVDEAEALVRDGSVDAAVVPSEGQLGLTVIGLDEAPSGVVAALSEAPQVLLLDPSDQNPGIVYLVALAFGIIFFSSALTFGQLIAQSVVEEKQTRIVEILMATVPVRVLLAGKVVGNSLLAFGQIVLIALFAGVGLLATGQDILLAEVGPSIVWFLVFFVIGFVMLAAMFAAAGALVSRQEDMGGAITPITMLIMVPYFLVIFFYDNPLVLGIMSYVPFSAPIGMPLRVFLGLAEWWEPLVSLVILVVSTLAIIAIGSRIYENGLLRMGAPVKLKDALKSAA